MAKMGQFKSEWRNASSGMAGAVQFDDDGKRNGIVVRPNEAVFFSEEERIATANAPRLDEDNPFENGTFVLVTPASEIKNRRHIGPDTLPEPQPEPEAETAVEPSEEELEAAEEAKAAARREQQDNIARQAQAQQARNAAEAAREAGVVQEEATGTPAASKEATASAPAQGSRPAREVVATPPAQG